VIDLDFVLLCFKHAPRLLRVSVCVSRSLAYVYPEPKKCKLYNVDKE